MRLLNFLQETTVYVNGEDEDAPYTFKNPLPRLDIRDPRFEDWFERGDAVIAAWLEAHNLTWRENIAQAKEAIGVPTRLPINKLLTIEEYLKPSALLRKAGDKFSSRRPVIYKVDGTYVVSDGNHRVVQAHLNGEKDIEVDLIDVDAFERQAA